MGCLAILATFAPAASARHECREHYPAGTGCGESEVTIRYRADVDRFVGRVDSHMRFCERDRVVLLRKERSGDDLTIDKTRSRGKGWWSFSGYDDPHGRFYAVARYREHSFGIDGRYICYRARSETIRP